MNQLADSEVVFRNLKTMVNNSVQNLQNMVTEELIRDLYDVAVLEARVQLGRDPEGLDKEAICARMELEVNVFHGEARLLVGDDSHVPWLARRRADIEWSHWTLYREMISATLAPASLARLDDVTDRILDLMVDPATQGQWDTRGLVMGHVQSGKTNNYIGLINKAVDAGYRVVVILTGMHDSLRAQTQWRVDQGFVGRNTESGFAGAPTFGVGLHRPGRLQPTSFTTSDSTGDFRKTTANAIAMNIDDGGPKVFVVKKNVTILRNLREWLNTAANKPVGHERIPGIPLLMIDDEADQASVDTAGGAPPDDEEHDPSAINRAIRGILLDFEQSAYVGYTATPMANVFIPDIGSHPVHGQDLFPRSFIISLEAPSNHIGPAEVFGISDPDSDLEEDGLPLVRTIADIPEWLPDNHRTTTVPGPVLPGSLKRAIDSFIVVCAARLAREAGPYHSSMLVHVTRFVDVQALVRDQIVAHIQDLLLSLRNDNSANPTVRNRLRALWDEDFSTTSAALAARQANGELAGHEEIRIHDFDEINEHLLTAASRIGVSQIAGTSKDVLDYRITDGVGHTAIVIGGDKLSRGLTLEGLSVSYYARPSRMYDTLMQMGRWFGYRPGYLDLCRMFTTSEIAGWYRFIALAIREMIGEFNEMARQGKTPREFGLRVRAHPALMVTNRTKLRSGERRRVTFSNTRPETTTFENDERTGNLSDAERLIGEITSNPDLPGRRDVPGAPGDRLWTGVPHEHVVGYLHRLADRSAYQNSRSVEPRYLAAYIERRTRDGGLTNWAVLLKSNTTPGAQRREFAELEIGISMRKNQNRLPGDLPDPADYSIKSLIGSRDEAADLDQAELAVAEELAPPGKDPVGHHFRSARSPEKSLLIIYLLHQDGDPQPDEIPYTGFSVSFPDDRVGGQQIEYIVNSVWQRLEE